MYNLDPLFIYNESMNGYILKSVVSHVSGEYIPVSWRDEYRIMAGRSINNIMLMKSLLERAANSVINKASRIPKKRTQKHRFKKVIHVKHKRHTNAWTCIHHLCVRGDLETIKLKKDLLLFDNNLLSECVRWAAKAHQPHVVHYFIKLGESSRLGAGWFVSGMRSDLDAIKAVYRSKIILQILEDNGFALNWTQYDAITYAIAGLMRAGNVSSLHKLLMEFKKNNTYKYEKKMNYILESSVSYENLSIIKFLIDYPDTVVKECLHSAFQVACQNGYLRITRYLYRLLKKYGLPKKLVNIECNAMNNNVDMLRFIIKHRLIKHGDIPLEEYLLRNIMMIVIKQRGNIDVMRFFLETLIDMNNISMKRREEWLMWAVETKRLPMIRYLIAIGC